MATKVVKETFVPMFNLHPYNFWGSHKQIKYVNG